MSEGVNFLTILERIITCITPVILAVIGLRQTRANKKVEEFTRVSKELAEMRDKEDQRQKKELDEHFKKIEGSFDEFKKEFSGLSEKVESLSKLDRQLRGLIELSQVNFEFCQSLSTIVSGIADALDSTDQINSEGLKTQLADHHKTEQALAGRILKIVY